MKNRFANMPSAPRLARDQSDRPYVTYDEQDTLRYVYIDRSLDEGSKPAISESLCMVSRLALENVSQETAMATHG